MPPNATKDFFKNNYGQRAPSDVLFCEMPDEFCNLRIIHNRLSSQQLFRILDLRGWNERSLAERSGIVPSVVSAHLSGQRPIRPHHLAAYLSVPDGTMIRQRKTSLTVEPRAICSCEHEPDSPPKTLAAPYPCTATQATQTSPAT
jgi:hypothetical protein